MRNIFILPAFLLAVTFLAACQPNSNTPSPTNPTNYSGIFICSYIREDTNTYFAIEDVFAEFVTTPGGTTPAFVDSVHLNNDKLTLDAQDSTDYQDWAFFNHDGIIYFNGNATWQVYGANGVPSFTYNHNVPYPVYNGPHLPDTVYKSAGITIPLNIIGADSVFVSVGMDNNTLQPITKSFAANASTGSFSAQELANAYTSPMAGSVITIRAGKYSIQSFGNKSYLFVKATNVGKTITMLP